ncbi:TPA: hypothetical protein I3313_004868 [Enterobacter hormaechei subsp. hoffmannii]|uniref:hypothetical protein n=1 Tax=Enterobacter hormaechei TaxID=158836 RepID=UPI0007C77A66|nr:hypothetical protein [Enterobacter hormaechei]RTN58055.1 hypothetical protein EKN91_01710 [Enterobacter hormaechei]HAS0829818.1 hypothetical protein [Enterobacter hormaechei subsp. hoffmannii]HAT7668721.1 hypothetical protein [Enterobacter hormaechei subsp. hoffmannii]
MKIKIYGNVAEGNGLDGIRIVAGNGADIEIGQNELSGNGRHGINIIQDLDKLFAAGLKKETPLDVLELANDEFSKLQSNSINDKIEILKRPMFSKWFEQGANIATIASLIIQIFSK